MTNPSDETSVPGVEPAHRSEGRSWFAEPEAILDALRAAPNTGALPDVRGYEILHELARGGQGIVYVALQRSTRRRVALKVLVERGFATAAARRRFEREIELLASIDHPGIVKVFDSGVTGEGLLYLVMELVQGEPFDRHLAARRGADGFTPLDDALGLTARVADAVHAAHRRGVIHRDLKPSNVLVDADGQPRVVDFGLARALDRAASEPTVSVTGQFLGSLPWASPEHASGRPDDVDIRSDVYSLGVMLHQALTNEFPYPVDGSLAATLRTIAETAPERPSARRRGLPRDLDAVSAAALAKRADDRYATAADFAADVRAVLAGEAIRARRDTAWIGMSRRLRRYRLITAVVSASAVAVAGFAVLAWRNARVAEAQRTLAERRFAEARELARSFLFDFHESLLPLAGSRPAREKLVTTSLAYLAGLEREVGDDSDFRADLAAAYERIADIQGNPTFPNLGQSAEAIESLRKAVTLREANLADRPDDGTTLQRTARAFNLIGLIQAQLGKNDDALAAFELARPLLDRAVELMPGDVSLLRECAANRDRASTVYDTIGQQERSLALIDEGLAFLASSPDQKAMRDAIGVLAYKKAFVLRRLNRLEEALASVNLTISLAREQLAEEPGHAPRRRGLSVDLNERATIEMALGRLDDADATLAESIAIARSLHDADPSSPTTINDLAYALIKAAQLNRQRKRIDEALAGYLAVRDLRAEASKRDPANAVIRRGVAIAVAMAGEAAAEAAADESLGADRRRSLRERGAQHYEDAADRLDAMKADGTLLQGDESLAETCRGEAAKLRAANAADA
jgi:serine/threonine protein kinase